MAYAAYKELGGQFFNVSTLVQTRKSEFVVLVIFVPSLDAYRVRQTLAASLHVGILRCTPHPTDSSVQLDLHLPLDKVADVMADLMASVPTGQIGRISTWSDYLAAQSKARFGSQLPARLKTVNTMTP